MGSKGEDSIVPGAEVIPDRSIPQEQEINPVFVKADEVDETGANISFSHSDKDTNHIRFYENQSLDVPVALSQPKDEAKIPTPMTRRQVPTRPKLSRETSQPAPPQKPPPVPSQQSERDSSTTTDSLSLMQLKKIVTEIPKVEATTYAFTYNDTATPTEELEEWFTYSDEEREGLLHAQETFESTWKTYRRQQPSVGRQNEGWIETNAETRRKFIMQEVAGLEHPEIGRRGASLEALLYVGLGLWYDTAGVEDNGMYGATGPERQVRGKQRSEEYPKSPLQLKWMRLGAEAIYDGMGIQAIFDVLRGACLRAFDYDHQGQSEERAQQQKLEQRELQNSLTLMYLLVEASRQQVLLGNGTSLRDELVALDPSILIFLVKILAQLRWDDSNDVPLTKILLLLWKSILLLFGSSNDLARTKSATQDGSNRTFDERGRPLITASPLDYHLFRQEITSKYPAYNPPAPLLPLELENNSILPPLPNHPSRNIGHDGLFGIGPANINSSGGSILHQPVHIATPAPSPPPSPAGPGGKAGKKQNYQTNQNFPFLYPPLDRSSNWAGGKGNPGMQEMLGNTRWDGSDIPTSILEAGTLFASRMRMTRAMRQLWEERERYMKYERGWSGAEDNADVDRLDFSNDPQIVKNEDKGTQSDLVEHREVERRLAAVEDFYRSAMPHLQSLVIVLLKAVLPNVTALMPQTSNGLGGLASGLQSQDSGNDNGQAKPKPNGNNGRQVNGANHEQNDPTIEFSESIPEELEVIRSREITAKAVSGMLLLLLKWLKISHILKYEYLTQLLLDSSYLPLILKLFAHQELERVIDSKSDREELSFFRFCRMSSKNPSSERQHTPESDDDACPPPIPRHRKEQIEKTPVEPSRQPEVDELGYPTTELPSEPITSFSWRNFFSTINFLRIMQKICKGKAHRNLLLVQYKSSNYLKKNLKIPQPTLRRYTLKLFKNQVPYCGRKWRQSNMRVITAVYLHCRPELRDDWLAGSDVDAEVEEALPLEQALRALTHWHNLKRYPEQMGAHVGVLAQEQDFFLRELEKMDWGEEVVVSEEVPAPPEGWEGPLQIEGW